MLLIGNGRVITRAPKTNAFIDNGAVAIDGNVIKEVGETAALKQKYKDAAFIDAKQRLVMPGFINTHMHYYSTFARGMNAGGRPPTTFMEILRGLWWKLDKLLTLDDVYYSAINPMLDSIKSGVTTVVDHHASPFAVTGSLFKIAEAAKLFGLRSNLCYETSDRDGPKIADEGIAENLDFAKYCNAQNDDMLTSLFGMHASCTISNSTLEKVVRAADDAGVGFHMHCAEGIEDQIDSLEKYNLRVIERLYNNGVLNKKSIAVHCVNINEAEEDLLAESNVAVVHNPESNMGNAVGATPFLELFKKGVLVGMGTDGYTSDMTESYKTELVLQRHVAKCPSTAWNESADALFVNNKNIIARFIKGKVGVLEAGAWADVIIVDYNPPTPITEANINGHILFGVSGRHVDSTIINGKIIYNERKLVDIDEAELLAKSREHAEKVWAKL
jgi:putative selenium metabolism protein SsnA